MCGIFGFSGDFDELLLSNVVDIMSHRGPDDHGIYFNLDFNLALLHTRLSIIDLSPLGHQPMHFRDDVVIVFNGEIYNFRYLRENLESKGYVFRSQSDTEVLLKLYLDSGLEMLRQLNGIFSIAIFDKRTEDLFIIRDHFGIKPLYYSANSKGVVFSSEIKSLNAFLSLNITLDIEAINRYLTYLYCPGAQTPVREIKKLDPGHVLQVYRGKIKKQWQWYQPPEVKRSSKGLGVRESISAVQDGLRRAVKSQMVADVPVGAFLSGGLDSSAVVAFAKQIEPNLRCFTIESEGGTDKNDHNDLPYAIKVAKHLDVKLDIVKADPASLVSDLNTMIWHLDEPLADPAALNVLYISRLARENDIKVLLSGAGGDDLFTGYRRHLALKYEKLWDWLPSKLLRGFDIFAQSLNQNSRLNSRLNRLFLNSGKRGDQRITKFFAWSREKHLLALYSKEMRAELERSCVEQPLLDYLKEQNSSLSDLDKMLSLEQRFFLTDHNLTYTDKMSMAAGVEVRVPFLDPDLVKIASEIPSKYKQRRTTGKWILKKAMEEYLPHDVIYRPKTGFNAPLRRWIKTDLRDLVSDTLTKEKISSRGIFDPVAVQNLIQSNDMEIYDGSYTIFSILCIEIWCQLFLDSKNI